VFHAGGVVKAPRRPRHNRVRVEIGLARDDRTLPAPVASRYR
jgi:hypothetical protein